LGVTRNGFAKSKCKMKEKYSHMRRKGLRNQEEAFLEFMLKVLGMLCLSFYFWNSKLKLRLEGVQNV
jgi:hypothetical protein